MRVLAISAHPDDETLGCGGTLLKHAAAGDDVAWLIATEAHEPGWTSELIAEKAGEVGRVADAYSMTSVTKLGLPTAQLDSIPFGDLIAGVHDAVAAVTPEVVYVVHRGDVHTDHDVLFRAVMSVLKPFHMASLGVKRVLSFETLSSTDAAAPSLGTAFVPTVFSDISAFLERKIEIMGLFETEAQPDPMPRGPSAIRALARSRGATVGLEYAEAFMLIREIQQ